jgi:hypothetical protein
MGATNQRKGACSGCVAPAKKRASPRISLEAGVNPRQRDPPR